MYLHENEPVLNLKEIARVVGLSYSCVKEAVKRVRENDLDELPDFGIVKKGRKPKTTPEMSRMVKDHLTGSRTATLSSAKKHLADEGIIVWKTTVWRLANMEDISYKRTAFKGEVVLSQRIMDRRFEFGGQVDEMADDELWYLDETGFNLHIGVTRSWSEIGETPVVIVPANKGQNVSALVCISTSGVMSIAIKDGAFNSVDFIEFLSDLIYRHQELLRGEKTLVMDNARIHHAVDVINFLEENQIRYMFLPPYSPELNPIELFFGTVKAAYRKDGPARTRAEMKRRIRDTFNTVDEGIDMTRYYSHMRQFVAKAVNREQFFFTN